jgi:hypothetical protein
MAEAILRQQGGESVQVTAQLDGAATWPTD